MRHAGTGGAEPGDLGRRQVHGVGQPHVAAEPPQLVEVLDRRAAVALAAVLLLVEGLGQMGVEPDTQVRARTADSVRSSPVTENGEQGATAMRTIAPGAWIVEALDRVPRRVEDGVDGLDDLVRRQPAAGPAEVHRSPAGVEPQPDPASRIHCGAEQVARTVGKHVVVVGGGRAARLREPGQPGRGGRADHRLGDACPHRIELGEPLEQRGVLRVSRAWPTGKGDGAC